MATNRDVLRLGGLEKLFLRIDRSATANFDSAMDIGSPKYGCVIDMVTQQSDCECLNCRASTCAQCISQWLDEEYDGTWEIDPD